MAIDQDFPIKMLKRRPQRTKTNAMRQTCGIFPWSICQIFDGTFMGTCALWARCGIWREQRRISTRLIDEKNNKVETYAELRPGNTRHRCRNAFCFQILYYFNSFFSSGLFVLTTIEEKRKYSHFTRLTRTYVGQTKIFIFHQYVGEQLRSNIHLNYYLTGCGFPPVLPNGLCKFYRTIGVKNKQQINLHVNMSATVAKFCANRQCMPAIKIGVWTPLLCYYWAPSNHHIAPQLPTTSTYLLHCIACDSHTDRECAGKYIVAFSGRPTRAADKNGIFGNFPLSFTMRDSSFMPMPLNVRFIIMIHLMRTAFAIKLKKNFCGFHHLHRTTYTRYDHASHIEGEAIQKCCWEN